MVPPLQQLPALNKTLPFRRAVLASFSPPLSLRHAEKNSYHGRKSGRGKEEEEATLQNFRGGNGEWWGGVLFYDIALLAPAHTRLVLRTGLLISVRREEGKMQIAYQPTSLFLFLWNAITFNLTASSSPPLFPPFLIAICMQ